MSVSVNERLISDEQTRHWRKRKLKFVSSVRTSNVDKHMVEGETGVRLCNYTDVYYHENITPDMSFMQASATESEIECFGLKKGQVLLTKDSESWEDIAVPAYVAATMPEVVCGYHLAVIEPDSDEVDGRFLSWLAQSPVLNDQFKLSAKGVTRFGLSQHALKNALIDVPPLEYQLKVASFLDRKTTEIDTLIAKKRRLLDRLAEKRTALITRAVTKGLNPDASMKDSGIEWLGGIPAHWEVKKLKFLGDLIIGLTYSPADVCSEAEGTLVLRASNIQRGRIILNDNVYVDTEVPDKLRTKIGDILICSRNGSQKLVGKAAIIDGQSSGMTFGAFNTVLRSSHGHYLFYLFASGLVSQQAGLYQTSTIFQLTTGMLKEFRVPVPPDEDQEKIIAYIQKQLVEHDKVADKIDSALRKLKEYRSALITNAVTGQIKVA